MSRRSIVLAVAAVTLLASRGFAQATHANVVVGTWRGTSLCLVKPSSCNDEHVVYRVTALDSRDSVSIDALKVVNGQEEEMGVRGWADVALADDSGDCIAIDDVNHHALFPRVAAVVHHGGAGTTAAAARSGTPQVIVPQMYDQPYWATRVVDLGIGAAHPRGAPALDALTTALRSALAPEVATHARAIGAQVRTDGAARAAERLVSGLFG